MKNGTIWADDAGKPIQAHGGMILEHDGVFYWYGEDKGAPNASKDGALLARVDVIGVSCYSSRNLRDWHHEGVVLPPALALPGTEAEDAVLCRCEAVTVGDVRRAVRLGATGPNRVKTFTRCGMGSCQGRVCASPLTRLVAQETGSAPDAVGALRVRAPLKPVLLRDYLEPPEVVHAG